MKALFEKTPSRLTCLVREEEARKPLNKVAILEEGSNLRHNVGAHVSRRAGDLIDNRRPTIDNGNDVFEVVAHVDVIATASVKCLQLRGHEQCRGDDPYGVSGDSEGLGRFDRIPIPPVAESEHAGVRWHDD